MNTTADTVVANAKARGADYWFRRAALTDNLQLADEYDRRARDLLGLAPRPRPSHYTEPTGISCTPGADIGTSNGTAGHATTQPGLRGHSIGDTYPWRVVGYGDGLWAVIGPRENTWGDLFAGGDACEKAHESARAAKLLHPLGYVEVSHDGTPHNISGPLSEIPARLAGEILIVDYCDSGPHQFIVCASQPDPAAVKEGVHLLRVLNCGNGELAVFSIQWLARNALVNVTIGEV